MEPVEFCDSNIKFNDLLLNQVKVVASGIETIQDINQVIHVLDGSVLKNIPVSLLIQFFDKNSGEFKKRIKYMI